MAEFSEFSRKEGPSEPGVLPRTQRSSPPQLRLWEGSAQDATAKNEDPDELAAQEMMRWSRPSLAGVEPYSLEWYQRIENVRYARQGSWMPGLLEFNKHAGEVVLGIGEGLGTDWVQYAREGAEVIVCSHQPEQLELVRRNFQLRNLSGSFLLTYPDFCRFPLETCSLDVAFLNGLPVEVDKATLLLDEIYRILKPGGKVVTLAPAAHDIDYWKRRILGFTQWYAGQALRRTQPLGTFGGETWTPAPDQPGHTARELYKLFARYAEPRHWKRHLRRADIPHPWRWFPCGLLERFLGRLLIFKAFKPLSALRTDPLVA